MNKMRVACKDCAGLGYEWRYEVIPTNTEVGASLMEKRIPCESCGGTGYMEYAVFTVKEAEAILKHCGLSTES